MSGTFMDPALEHLSASLRRTLVRHTPEHRLIILRRLFICFKPSALIVRKCIFLFVISSLLLFSTSAQEKELADCNITWTSQSKNSGESMPCGGGDIGLNVWVEKGELFFYLSKSGTFDENNGFLKLGRIRIKLSPNPFGGNEFKQELALKDGSVKITASNGNIHANIKIWVDVFNPVVHVDINSSRPLTAEAVYESWRYKDRLSRKGENNANSYKWINIPVTTYRDEIAFKADRVIFYHRNKPAPSVFDLTVAHEGMQAVKDQLFNPLKDLTFGGALEGTKMQPAGTTSGTYLDTDFRGWKLKSRSASRSYQIACYLHTAQTPSITEWELGLEKIMKEAISDQKIAKVKTLSWWKEFWDRSYIFIDPDNVDEQSPQWQSGRNYQLFRYMLGCNAFGKYPTKFNGGLFTYDPSLTNSGFTFTPDFRNWGGGLMTAQNQRLVYFPMIKSGDFDMMKPQFDFYMRSLKNAELRSEVYWGHKGACFTEQLENFGLPNIAEYGFKRPAWFDKGMQYNAWLEYEWDTVLEFCLMMLEQERYAGKDISTYIPFIESCLTFFNEHYQYLARRRGRKSLDGNGKLILYPGSAGETYKMAYNSSSTIAALTTILNRLMELPSRYLDERERKHWDTMLHRIPPISFTQFDGHTTIAPARHWERINNVESMQLYPVFPWGIYGVGKPGLDTAINTWKYDTNAIRFRSFKGWKQDNIFAARLGLNKEAAKLTTMKLKDSERRFPAFWGPGFDWTPDHNWGGSGMIGLQEMLLQADGKKIYLFPAWPKNWDVHFKLHAPYQTTVEGTIKNGKLVTLKVLPESRMKDVVNMF